MESILKSYFNKENSSGEDSDSELSRKNNLLGEDEELYKQESEQSDKNSENSIQQANLASEPDLEEINHNLNEEEEYGYEEDIQYKAKLPSFAQVSKHIGNVKPKFLKSHKPDQKSEFDVLNSYKKTRVELKTSASKGPIVEEVIERKEELVEPEESGVGAIEERIAQQKMKVNPFLKSRVVKTTFEMRQQKRNRTLAKGEREKKRNDKMNSKDESKQQKFKGQHGGHSH